MNRASGTHGTITKYFNVHVIAVPGGEEEKGGTEEVVEEIGGKFPQFGKRYKPTDSRNSEPQAG